MGQCARKMRCGSSTLAYTSSFEEPPPIKPNSVSHAAAVRPAAPRLLAEVALEALDIGGLEDGESYRGGVCTEGAFGGDTVNVTLEAGRLVQVHLESSQWD